MKNGVKGGLTVPELLLVGEPYLAGVVDLGPEHGVRRQGVLHSHGQAGGASHKGPKWVSIGRAIFCSIPSLREQAGKWRTIRGRAGR